MSKVKDLLRPLLISRHAPVSTLVVFVGVIGGVSAFGMIGVIIGPVLLTVIAELLRFLDLTRRWRYRPEPDAAALLALRLNVGASTCQPFGIGVDSLPHRLERCLANREWAG
jgi:hypothetical protein